MTCNAAHPSLTDVRCGREPGPNARTEATYETDDDGRLVLDDDGNPVELEPARDVHVHSGKSADGGTHRWEDVS
jgi:hypothetical protein